jgi:D-beta-D-heptose 7-phosphate kinase/D-beta-D-heptose 1-phosphate adenosyltransferase
MPDIRNALRSLSRGRVLVLGDAMLDEYILGECVRLSPEAPVPVVRRVRGELRPGGAANVVRNLIALSARSALICAVGDDESGVALSHLLDEIGCLSDGVIVDRELHTPRKTRIIASGQQIVRIDDEAPSPLPDRLADVAVEHLEEMAQDYDVILISDYAKGFVTPKLMKGVLDVAATRRKFVMIDPKPANINLYRGVGLIKPNRREAAEISGIEFTDPDSLIEAGKILHEKFCPDYMLVTAGEMGMFLIGPEEVVYRVPTLERRVYDVSGAGDTVIATVAAAFGGGAEMLEAVMLANAAAAGVVTKLGTSTVASEELARLIIDYPSHDVMIV